MSTLELTWDQRTVYRLWSWNNGNIHYTAQLVRRIEKGVYMIRIGQRGMEPTNVVAVKVARGKEEVEDMEREAGLYEHQLKDLQGTVVPNCYGFYTAKVQGQSLGCLLLEYCSGLPADPEHAPELNRKALAAAYALHAAGVLHGDLQNRHHFVPMGRDVRIVDFSVAVPHTCIRGLSRRAQGHDRHSVCGCPELAVLESVFGH